MKRFGRLLGLGVFGALVVPFLFVQAQAPNATSVSQLMTEYRKGAVSDKLEERRKAADVIYDYSRNLGAVVTSLMNRLSDPDVEIRSKAAMALAEIGPSAKLAGPRLVKMLEKEKESGLRIRAANAIGAIFFESYLDEFDNKIIIALARALREDRSVLVRYQACIALGSIGPGAKDAMGDLINVMLTKESDTKLRELTRSAILSVASPACANYAPLLLDTYRKGKIEEPTKLTILRALGQIAAKEDVVVPLLVDVLGSNAALGRLRGAAAYGLCAMGSKAKSGVPALVLALEASLKRNDDDSLNLRQNIFDGLNKLGPDASAAVPALVDALERSLKVNDEHSRILRQKLFDVLRQLGPPARVAAPTLRRIAGDLRNPVDTRSRATRTLKAIEETTK